MLQEHQSGAKGLPLLMRCVVILLFVLGLGTFLYPLVSNSLYEKSQEETIAAYNEGMTRLADDGSGSGSSTIDLSAELAAAQAYNTSLLDSNAYLTDPFDESHLHESTEPYASLLNIDGDGMMGYLEIPKISCELAIYHGTSADVLESGVGHLESTSLPVGGTGTHSVLSGHTGLGDKKLFTDLDQLEVGDMFYIHVLGQTLAYQVDQILVVEPDDTSSLKIDPDQDYVTLVTCTPYGQNTHRLLVRGTRVAYDEEAASQDTEQVNPLTGNWAKSYFAAIALCALLVIVAFIVLRLRRRASRKKRDDHK